MWAIKPNALNRRATIGQSRICLREKNLSFINNYICLNYDYTEMDTCEVKVTLGFIDNCLYYFIIIIYMDNSTMTSHDAKSHVFRSTNISPHLRHNHIEEKRLYFTIIINRGRTEIDSGHLSNLLGLLSQSKDEWGFLLFLLFSCHLQDSFHVSLSTCQIIYTIIITKRIKKKTNERRNRTINFVSKWLLFNVNAAIFQLYHGENKLIFNEMMMKSALY